MNTDAGIDLVNRLLTSTESWNVEITDDELRVLEVFLKQWPPLPWVMFQTLRLVERLSSQGLTSHCHEQEIAFLRCMVKYNLKLRRDRSGTKQRPAGSQGKKAVTRKKKINSDATLIIGLHKRGQLHSETARLANERCGKSGKNRFTADDVRLVLKADYARRRRENERS